jgi:hypothetical protein
MPRSGNMSLTLLSPEALKQIETSPAREFIRAYNPRWSLEGVDIHFGRLPTDSNAVIPVLFRKSGVDLAAGQDTSVPNPDYQSID